MTTEHEELAFDSDGIPILTELIRDDAVADPQAVSRQEGLSSDKIASELLQSEAFREQLDELAAELARDVRQQLEQSLRPVIDVAISHALDSGDNNSHQAIREQLEAALPDLLAQSLQK